MNVAVIRGNRYVGKKLIQQLDQYTEHLMVRKVMVGSLENLVIVVNAIIKELFVTIASKTVEVSLV